MNIKSVGTRFYRFAAIPFAASLLWQHAALAHTVVPRLAFDLDAVTMQMNALSTASAPIPVCSSPQAFGDTGCGSALVSAALRTNALFTSPLQDTYSVFETATMLGRDAFAEASDSVAIGHGAHAMHSNALAFGAGSTTSAEDSMSVGSEQQTRRIMHVTPGLADSDAATVSQLWPLNRQMDEQQQRFEALAAGKEGMVRWVPSRTEGDGIVEIADRLPGKLADLGGTLGPRRLSGVADGVSQNDAVNMRQYTMLRSKAVMMGNDISQNAMDIATANSVLDDRRKLLDLLQQRTSTNARAIEAHHQRLDDVTVAATAAAVQVAQASERLTVSEAGLREHAAGLSSLNDGLSGLLRRNPDETVSQFSLAPTLGGKQVSLSGVEGARRVSGVEAAVDDLDAVNLGQLKAAGLFDQIAPADDSVALGLAVVYDAPNLRRITFGSGGAGAAPVTLSNVAAGIDAHDAINAGQFQSIVAALGASAALGADGTVQAPAFSVGAQQYDNLGAALGAIDSAVAGNARALGQNASGIAENRAAIDGQATTISENTARIETNFHALDDNLEQVSEAVATVQQHAAAIADQASGLETQQALLDEQALKVQSHQATLDRQATDLQSHQDTLEGHANDLQAQQAALANHADDLRSQRVAIDGHTSDLQSHATLLERHTHDLRTHETTLTSQADELLAHKSAIDAHHLNLQAHQAQIGALETGDAGLVRRLRGEPAADAAPGSETLAIAADLGGQRVQFTGTSGPRRLAGVLDAAEGTDAVNLRQLQAAGLANADLTQAAVTDMLAHVVSYDDAAHTALTLGSAGTPVHVANLANGTAPADAVNVRQLHDLIDTLGGGAALAADGRLTPPVYTLSGVGYGNLADALGAVDLNITRTAKTLQAHAADISATRAGLDDTRANLDARLDELSASISDVRIDGHQESARAVRYDNVKRTDITLGERDASGGSGMAVRLHNLAEGVAPRDAVNVQQWRQANASLTAGLAGNNRRVDKVSRDLVDARRRVAALETVSTPSQTAASLAPHEAASSGDAGAVAPGDSAQTARMPGLHYDSFQRDHLTLGADGAPATLSGVADGVAANEAVNRKQLDALGMNVATLDQRVAHIETGGGAVAAGFFATDAGSSGAALDDVALTHVAGIGEPDGSLPPAPTNAMVAAHVDAGTGGMAAGNGAGVSGKQGIAHGEGAQAIADRSVALGAGAQADRANTVSVGAPGSERQLVNVADASVDTDAINFRQMRGMMAAQSSATEQAANRYTDQRVDQVDRAVHDLDQSTRRGIAAAAALQNTAPYLPGHTALNAGVAGYRGEAALAISVSSWNAQGTVNWNLGLASAGHDSTIVRAGVGFLIN